MKRGITLAPGHGRALTYAAVLTEWSANDGWPVTVTDVCRRTGQTRSVAFRHLTALAREGRIEKGPGRFNGWRPAPDERR